MCGTTSGLLSIFSIDGENINNIDNLFLHSDEITSFSINNNLNMFATVSKDGYLFLYILPSFSLVRAIKLSTKIKDNKNENKKEVEIQIEKNKEEEKYKNMFEEQKIKYEKNENNEDNENININENNLSNKNEIKQKKEQREQKDNKENRVNRSNSTKDEEKKNKLLNIISSKKYNKFQRREIEKENIEKDKPDTNKEKGTMYKSIDAVQRDRLKNNIKPKILKKKMK